MKKSTVLEEYYLIEDNNTEINLVGWKVIGKVKNITYHSDFSLKTTIDGWLDEFGIHVLTQLGLVLVSENCPLPFKDDILEAVGKYIESDEFRNDEDLFKQLTPVIATETLEKLIEQKSIPTWISSDPYVFNSGTWATTSTTSTGINSNISSDLADSTKFTTVDTSSLANAISSSITSSYASTTC